MRDLWDLAPAQARLEEARYFLEQYLHHSSPPQISYPHMIAYFDAFIFAYGTVPELLTPEHRIVVRKEPIVRFLIALRNINTHHAIIAASLREDSKFQRPFSRRLQSFEVGGPMPPLEPQTLTFLFEKLQDIFDRVKAEGFDPKTLEIASDFAAQLRQEQEGFLDDIMGRGIAKLEELLLALGVS